MKHTLRHASPGAKKATPWLGIIMMAIVLPMSALGAERVGFALDIGEPIGATDGSQCGKPGAAGRPVLSLSTPDIASWNRARAAWVAELPSSYQGEARELADRCVELRLDDEPPIYGLLLSKRSERLPKVPTLWLDELDRDTIELAARSAEGPLGSAAMRRLDDILSRPAHLGHQMQRMGRAGASPENFAAYGAAWARSVGALLEKGKIGRGSAMEDIVELLGPPTRSFEREGKPRRVWYFETPMHSNPIFWVEFEDGRASGLSLSKF